MKKTLSIILAILMIVTSVPYAFAGFDAISAEGECTDTITWNLTEEGTLTVSGEGAVPYDSQTKAPWSEHIEYIRKVVIEEGITNMYIGAFEGAASLEEVILPDSLETIGALTFNKCESLKIIEIPENVTEIGNFAFCLCSALEEINFPEGLVKIGYRAFFNCDSLISVELPDTVESTDDSFEGCSSLEYASLSSSMKEISESLFSVCSRLSDVYIPEGIEKICSHAFSNCYNLDELIIPASVTEIEESAFEDCNALIHYLGERENLTNNSNYSDFHYVTAKEATEADCGNPAYAEGLYCSECECYYEGGNETGEPVGDHNFVGGICDVCSQRCEHPETELGELCECCGMVYDYDPITVGDTTIEIIDENSVYKKFVVEETGTYVITSSDISGEDECDPYVYLCDSTLSWIDEDDDCDGSLHFELVFDAVEGETYYFSFYAYESDCVYNVNLDKYVAFTHQPTSAEPYVELNLEEDNSYKWYEVDYQREEIINDGVSGRNLEDEEEGLASAYDEEEGWLGFVYDDSTFIHYCNVYLEEGECAVVIPQDYCELIITGLDGNDEEFYECEKGDELKFTAEESGWYYIYGVNEDTFVSIRVYNETVSYGLLEGETSAVLENPQLGKYYVCEATVGQKTVKSDVFFYDYAITHQPTAAEPYVELNETENISYQWIEGVETSVHVDDKVGTASWSEFDRSELDDVCGVYDADSGYWYGRDYFVVTLKEGDSIDLEFTEEIETAGALYLHHGGMVDSCRLDVNGKTHRFFAPMDARYGFFAVADESVGVKATVNTYKYEEAEGQTTNRLTDAEFGNMYKCLILADGAEIETDTFEYERAITAQPTEGELRVETNAPATYQWFNISYGEEITDEHAESIDGSTYSEKDGWTANRYGELFDISLENGESITVVTDSENVERIVAVEIETGYGYAAEEVTDGVYVITPEGETTEYVILVEDNHSSPMSVRSSRPVIKVRAYSGDVGKTEIEGATEAVYVPDEIGKYICEVEFADGTTEHTAIVDYTCLHQGEKEVINASENDCTNDGYTGDIICKICGKKAVSGEVLSATGHTFTEKIIDDAHLVSVATDASPAIYKYDCADCDAISEKATFTHGSALNTLGKPSKITATQSTNSVTISWPAVKGAFGYRIFQKTSTGWKKLADTTKLSYTIKNLSAGTKYTFAVRAGKKVDGNTVLANSYTTVNTATQTVRPSKITAAQNTSAIKLSWPAVKGATGYRIYYKSAGVWKVCVNSTTATSHTFSNLKAGAKFTFAVRPYTKVDDVVIWSAYTEFTTATKPATVTAKTSSPSKGKIALSWNQASGADGYQIFYKTGNGAYKLYKTVNKNTKSMSFSNLRSGTKYTFVVRAGIKSSGGNIYGAYKEAPVTVK